MSFHFVKPILKIGLNSIQYSSKWLRDAAPLRVVFLFQVMCSIFSRSKVLDKLSADPQQIGDLKLFARAQPKSNHLNEGCEQVRSKHLADRAMAAKLGRVTKTGWLTVSVARHVNSGLGVIPAKKNDSTLSACNFAQDQAMIVAHLAGIVPP